MVQEERKNRISSWQDFQEVWGNSTDEQRSGLLHSMGSWWPEHLAERYDMILQERPERFTFLLTCAEEYLPQIPLEEGYLSLPGKLALTATYKAMKEVLWTRESRQIDGEPSVEIDQITQLLTILSQPQCAYTFSSCNPQHKDVWHLLRGYNLWWHRNRIRVFQKEASKPISLTWYDAVINTANTDLFRHDNKDAYKSTDSGLVVDKDIVRDRLFIAMHRDQLPDLATHAHCSGELVSEWLRYCALTGKLEDFYKTQNSVS